MSEYNPAWRAAGLPDVSQRRSWRGSERKTSGRIVRLNGSQEMIASIRVADIPVFLIAMIIGVAAGMGFAALCQHGVVDARLIPKWLFTAGCLVVVGVSLWLASALWRSIQKAFRN